MSSGRTECDLNKAGIVLIHKSRSRGSPSIEAFDLNFFWFHVLVTLVLGPVNVKMFRFLHYSFEILKAITDQTLSCRQLFAIDN